VCFQIFTENAPIILDRNKRLALLTCSCIFMTLKAVNFFTDEGPITFLGTIFYGVGWLVISMGIRVEPRICHAG
jgi:hypothetical protein